MLPREAVGFHRDPLCPFFLTSLLSAPETEDAHAGSWKESWESLTAIFIAPTRLFISLPGLPVQVPIGDNYKWF